MWAIGMREFRQRILLPVAIALVATDRGKPSQGEINSNILFSKRMDVKDGYNQLNLQCRLVPGTERYELFER